MILSRQFIITLKELSVFVPCVLMCILPFNVWCTWNDACQEVVMVANVPPGYEPRWWSWSWLQWSCLTMASPDETRPEYRITECIWWYVLRRRRGAGRHSSASLAFTLRINHTLSFIYSPKSIVGHQTIKPATKLQNRPPTNNVGHAYLGWIWWKILILDWSKKNFFGHTEKLYLGSLNIFV